MKSLNNRFIYFLFSRGYRTFYNVKVFYCGMKDEVLFLDCEEHNLLPASPLYNDDLKKICTEKKYERVVLKTKYLSKTYDSNLRLKSISPFFMDVALESTTGFGKPLEEYTLPTGAIVRIYDDERGTQNIYCLEIPETKTKLKDLPKMYDALQEYQSTGKITQDFVDRWYDGYGILEHLMSDENITELNINPPAFKTSMRIIHGKYQECSSNILVSDNFLNFLLTRLKMDTGRPLNKAQPQIDGEINVRGVNARVAGIISPFSVFGVGFSIRKHRERPWTLPLFIKNKSVNPLFAGFMSLVISHGRAFLTAGPRGSGKTSLLGSLLLEILQRYRIITIEDTQELPINDYKKLGFDILPLKVRSALIDDSLEIPFDKGLRTSLRLGDSALIVGEVRSVEAKILYEAMRVGAMSNVVAGTIHADDPYGVYDRVVNDLGVPKGSFKSTDIIVIQNLIKDPSGVGRKRRVIQVTEVLKHWEGEPEFQDLFVYNPKIDALEPTEVLLSGKSVTLKNIMSRTEGYKDYNSVLDDMYLRAWAKYELLKKSKGKEKYLEAAFSSNANNLYMLLTKKLKPMDSRANMDKFKQEFSRGLDGILSGGSDAK